MKGHEARRGKPQIARIEADFGSATADRTAKGGDHEAHKGGHGGARRTTGGTITKNTMATKGGAGVARAGLPGGTADCADWGGLGVGYRRQDYQGEITNRTKGNTKAHEARRGIQSQRAQRGRSTAGGLTWAAREARAVGSGQRRATGGARKPPAPHRVFAVDPPRLSRRPTLSRRLIHFASGADPSRVSRQASSEGLVPPSSIPPCAGHARAPPLCSLCPL